MFSRIRTRLTYANVAATLALVFAMSGGALAASHFIITSTKQIKPSVLKQLKGKPGPPGPAGPTGAGTPGSPGSEGKKGENGTNGTNGNDGTSATTATFAGSAHGCEEGGVLVKSATPEVAVCNGKKGTTGFTETLPAGKTLKGVFEAVTHAGEALIPVATGISFGIPLAAAPTAHYIQFGETLPEGCSGTPTEPAASPGNLCVFAQEEGNVIKTGLFHPRIENEQPFGAVVHALSEGEGNAVIEGTWAVTG